MADSTLAEAIRRIILAPYPVTLKTLDTALKSSGPRGIKSWASSHPCQTPALAIAVVHALEFCPYAIPVIEQIGSVPAIRNAMLQEKPALISDFIEHALQSETHNTRYGPALLALLSSPLPQEFPHPASVIPYFLQCVRRATEQTTLETMRPLYTMAANGYSYIGELMSGDRRRHLSKQISRFVKKAGGPYDLTAMALATMAHIASMPGSGPVDAEGNTDPVDMFGGKKAPMILALITNIVISWTDSEKARWDETTENIRMVVPIAEVATEGTKEVVLKSAQDQAAIKRLLEKCTSKELHPEVLSEILRYVSALHSAATLPQIQEVFDVVIAKGIRDGRKDMPIPTTMAHLFATTENEDLVKSMLLSVIRLASAHSEPTSSHYSRAADRSNFAQNLLTYIPKSPRFRKRVLHLLSTDEFKTPLQEFLAGKNLQSPPQPCLETEACHINTLSQLQALQISLCQLILQAGIFSAAEDNAHLDPSLACALMDKQMRLSALTLSCPAKAYAQSHKSHSLLTILEAAASPETRMSSKNWRHDVAEGLSREADRSQNFIISSMGQIVADLEHRCETVEQPLHAEQKVSAQLRDTIQSLEPRCEVLEADLQSKDIELEKISKLATEYQRLLNVEASRKKDADTLIQELKDKLMEASEESIQLERSHESQLTKAKTEISRLRDLADTAAMEHLESLNNRQDCIDDLTASITRATAHIKTLETTIESDKTQIAELENLKNTLETENIQIHNDLKSLKIERDELATQRDNLEGETLALQTSVDSLQDERESLTTSLAAATAESTSLRTKLDSTATAFADARKNLSQQTEQITLMTSTLAEKHHLIAELEQRLETLSSTFDAKTTEYNEHLADLTSTHARAIADLQSDLSETTAQLQHDHDCTITTLKTSHTAAITAHNAAVADLTNTLKTRASEIVALTTDLAASRTETARLERKLKEQSRRDKDAQRLARQLMGLHGNDGSPSSSSPEQQRKRKSPEETPRPRTRRQVAEVENTPRPKKQKHVAAAAAAVVARGTRSSQRKVLAQKENRQRVVYRGTPSQSECGREEGVGEESVRGTQITQKWDESEGEYGSSVVCTSTPRGLREAERGYKDAAGLDETTMSFLTD